MMYGSENISTTETIIKCFVLRVSVFPVLSFLLLCEDGRVKLIVIIHAKNKNAWDKKYSFWNSTTHKTYQFLFPATKSFLVFDLLIRFLNKP